MAYQPNKNFKTLLQNEINPGGFGWSSDTGFSGGTNPPPTTGGGQPPVPAAKPYDSQYRPYDYSQPGTPGREQSIDTSLTRIRGAANAAGRQMFPNYGKPAQTDHDRYIAGMQGGFDMKTNTWNPTLNAAKYQKYAAQPAITGQPAQAPAQAQPARAPAQAQPAKSAAVNINLGTPAPISGDFTN